ncbi:hypothetical protein EV702DRAFT_1205370 [Suillus placidus]|uniref:Uncharacterized protein n=1 Tax=Suillus placidus TaxID=48579 RepID=A0A9P6ZFN7_9AGAM|nr:hypothetical protein EV702DRAFT_1205370 [Suillus placidus]
MQFIGSGEAAKAAVFYITEYITKGDVPMYIGLQALNYAMKMHEAKYLGAKDDDETHKARNLITKSVNAMMGRQETSHQQVMSYLVGGGDFYTSHTFQTFKWFEFTNAVNKFEHDAHKSEDGEVEDDADMMRIEELVTVNVSAENVEFSSDIQDYTLRPCDVNFDDLCLWEFIESTVKVKGNIDNQSAGDENESDDSLAGSEKIPKKPRRNRLPRANFLSEHGQRETHYLRLRKKLVVPVLLGAAIPRPDGSPEDYEMYCRDMLLLFKPWRSLKELKSEHVSWAESFAEQNFAPDLCKIIQNVNVENECKDARDQHAAMVVADRAKPHTFGSSGDGDNDIEEDMTAFDEALFANAALDPDETENVDTSTKHVGDVQTCLRSANDGGLLAAAGNVGQMNLSQTDQQTEQVTGLARERIQEYTSIMKAAKKKKRPLDVGAAESEAKRWKNTRN